MTNYSRIDNWWASSTCGEDSLNPENELYSADEIREALVSYGAGTLEDQNDFLDFMGLDPICENCNAVENAMVLTHTIVEILQDVHGELEDYGIVHEETSEPLFDRVMDLIILLEDILENA